MRWWWLFPAAMLLAAGGLVHVLVLGDLSDDADRRQLLTSGIFLLWWGSLTTGALILRARHRRADRSGPVRALPADQEPAGSQRWTLDQVAGALARELAPMRGVVVREGSSARMRVMLDPASGIRERQPGWMRVLGQRTGLQRQGLWWGLTWRAGHIPRVQRVISEVGVIEGEGGQVHPLWSPPIGAKRTSTHERAPLSAASATE